MFWVRVKTLMIVNVDVNSCYSDQNIFKMRNVRHDSVLFEIKDYEDNKLIYIKKIYQVN